jgi:hypothetical protein
VKAFGYVKKAAARFATGDHREPGGSGDRRDVKS